MLVYVRGEPRECKLRIGSGFWELSAVEPVDDKHLPIDSSAKPVVLPMDFRLHRMWSGG